MGISRIAALVVAAGTAVGCASFDVTSEAAPTADLKAIRSWAWVEGQGLGSQGSRVDREHVFATVAGSLTEGLAKAGVAAAGGGAPDAFVAFEIDLERVSRVLQYETSEGVGHTWRGFHSRTITETENVYVEYDLGTLIVDIVDARTGQFLWRGTARTAVDLASTRAEKESLARRAAAEVAEAFASAAK